jgi:hypothetical protein
MSRPCDVAAAARASAREEKPTPLSAICASVFKKVARLRAPSFFRYAVEQHGGKKNGLRLGLFSSRGLFSVALT